MGDLQSRKTVDVSFCAGRPEMPLTTILSCHIQIDSWQYQAVERLWLDALLTRHLEARVTTVDRRQRYAINYDMYRQNSFICIINVYKGYMRCHSRSNCQIHRYHRCQEP